MEPAAHDEYLFRWKIKIFDGFCLFIVSVLEKQLEGLYFPETSFLIICRH